MGRIVASTFIIAAAVTTLTSAASGGQTLHHDLAVQIEPQRHQITARDRITIPETMARDAGGAYRFVIHAGLTPRVTTPGWKLEQEKGPITASFAGINATTETVAKNVPLEGWRLIPAAGAPGEIDLAYSGAIHHPLGAQGEEYQRGFSETPGIIEERGAFLSGTTFWVPTFGEGLLTFDLEVADLAPPWDVVSQGGRVKHETSPEGTRTTKWSCPDPTEEIYLVAGPWTEYAQKAGEVDLLVFLRTADPALAAKYLEAGKRYMKLYESILPPYPFPSFALVENFWETGYGMPGFTLLGEKIIRFPWIITSSYPHELLHNWWGNSVYVDFSEGNWCEGLTAYMADHMFDEQKGEGATYRRATLQKYTDFVRGSKDFPLVSFRSRRSAASEAVGYGKSLMIYHMIRRAVGDKAFLDALSRFAQDHRFQRAKFSEIAAAFTAVTGKDWAPFFKAWTGSAGAPLIEVREGTVRRSSTDAGGWEIEISLRQIQKEDPFPITVPIAVTAEGSKDPVIADLPMSGRDGRISVSVPGRPLRLDVDPAFDLMRRLDPMEVPPALSTLFGDDDPLFVLPSRAPASEIDAWRALAGNWKREGKPRTAMDADLKELPRGTVWILGWSSAWVGEVAAGLKDQGVAVTPSGVTIGAESHEKIGRSIVLVGRRAEDPRAAAAWVAADPAAAIPGLARKLPHYTRYSHLAFKGDEPENVAKGMWEPTSSPLVQNLAGGPLAALAPPKRKPLADLPATFDADAMRRTVEALADLEMEGRGVGSAGLQRATDWVEKRFADLRLEPAGDRGFRQTWTWSGGTPPREATLTNLAGRLPGTDPNLADHPVLVMAHLDHLGDGRAPGARAGNEGKIHPGADDNASGVAVLLDLARFMASEARAARPVIFSVVTGEEWGLLGSRRLLESMGSGRLPFACVNLDTVGRLKDGKLHVLNSDSAREWRFIFMGVQATTGIQIAIVPEPFDASDQVACLDRGAPAVQIFTGPNADYHRPSDTADKIDAAGMAQVAEAAHEAIAYVAGRAEPLTVKTAAPAAARPGQPAAPQPGPRRASLGSMPDFSFVGPGVRVQDVVAGSPAEAAGMRPGDIIVALDGAEVTDLRVYSDLLKARQPGDKVEVIVRRGGEKVALHVTLGER